MVQIAHSLHERTKLHDGTSIPQLGLGVYEMTGKEAYQSVKYALDAGYRHIDTAEWYENETECGRGLNEWLKFTNTPRSEVFLTSKLRKNSTYDKALSDLKASLKRAQQEYFDLYLMHSAIGGPQARKEVWRALVDAQQQGLVKSIGVSNWGTKHIQELLDQGAVLPVINQIDLHPFMRHPDIVELCEKNNIALEAWGPLARGTRFDHPSIVSIAEKHRREPAQIFLRWGLQHGYVVIPKSVSQRRIVSNAKVFDFELDDEDMQELDGLDEHLVTDWDVVDCP